MNRSNTTMLTEEESTWIHQCAGRLRLIQADAATATPEKRREYLQEEIAHSLKGVPAANRKRYLNALLSRFPVAGQIAGSVSPAPPPPPAPVPDTPEQTIERFFAVAAELPEAQRSDLSRRLTEAGLVWVDREALVLEVPADAKQKLGLQPDQEPRLNRLVDLAVFLVEALNLLDQNALRTMRELGPRSSLLKRPDDFRRVIARFVTSEKETLDAQWHAMRSLMGGLLAAMQGGGKEFGRQFVGRLSPTAIEDVVEAEGGKLFGPNKKERCWDKYKDLSSDYATPDLVDRKVKDSMATFVEKTALGNR